MVNDQNSTQIGVRLRYLHSECVLTDVLHSVHVVGGGEQQKTGEFYINGGQGSVLRGPAWAFTSLYLTH